MGALAGNTVTGRNESGERAGARTLNLLAAPLTAQILRSLRDGPKQQADLRRETGHPAQSTLRTQLKKLCDTSAVDKRRRNRFPGVIEYELSEVGQDLLAVIEVLEHWLDRAPQGSMKLGQGPAKAAVKALTEAWSTTMLRALVAKPLTLTELDRVLPSINYPSLERRLAAMRLASLVEAHEGDGRGTPYGVTEWARQGVAPLITSARWERCHSPTETTPIAQLDIEAIFLLAANLIATPAGASGSCRLAVQLRGHRSPLHAGLLVTVRDGSVTSRTTSLEDYADAWVSGSLSAWLAAIVDHDLSGLELGGDGILARDLIDGLHGALSCLAVD